MVVLQLLFVVLIQLAILGLDIIGFVMVRVLSNHWPARPLLAMDRVGEPVVKPLIEAVDRAIPGGWTSVEYRRKHFTVAITLLVIAICRLALAGLIA